MALYIQEEFNIKPSGYGKGVKLGEENIAFTNSPYDSKICFLPYLNFLREKSKTAEAAEKLFIDSALASLDEEVGFKCSFENKQELEPHQKLVKFLFSGLFPVGRKDELLAMVSAPFAHDPFFISPALGKVLNSNNCITRPSHSTENDINLKYVWAGCHILNLHYGQNITHKPRFFFKIDGEGSEAARYFMSAINVKFVDVIPRGPLKKLSDADIKNLLSNIHDMDLWLEMLPPENFEFRGFVVGELTDISEEEAVSYLKQKLLEKDALTNREKINPLEEEVRILLKNGDLRVGVAALDYPERNVLHQYKIRYNLLADFCDNLLDSQYAGSIYEEACATGEPLLISDLKLERDRGSQEAELLARGIRSLIIYPLKDVTGNIIGIIEIGCPRPHVFNSFSLLTLNKVSNLFSLAMERSREEVDNEIEAVIREQYTTVHSSVEWKFVEQAYDLMNQREGKIDANVQAQPIRFPDVYPLFGQADIVGSSVLRNEAIRADLIENLRLVEDVFVFAEAQANLPLTALHLEEVRGHLARLSERYQTSDESEIVEFLQSKIHPYLRFLTKQSSIVVPRVNLYFNKIDESFHIVYNKRKEYEDSVSMLNKHISIYLERQQKDAQRIVPHYFEKYATDGVEFEIYAGNSIAPKKEFSGIHLHNLRLWQLECLCEITRVVHDIKDKLPVELTTAQMIFVYSQAVSIRFRLDEKHFDVDGAYNVRYKILKKRIDKAVTEDTGERITVSGKVAVVYTTEKDRLEYLEYLNYLKIKGVITDEIEELDIAPLQGVDGLRALRVTVVI